MGDWMGSQTRVDVVGGASKLPWVMMMLSVLFISTCPSSIHVMLVSGKLNPVMSTIKARTLPTVTSTVLSGEVMGLQGQSEQFVVAHLVTLLSFNKDFMSHDHAVLNAILGKQ